MELRAHDPVYITDLWILNRLDPTTIAAHTKIKNAIGKSIKGVLRLEILDPDAHGRVCASSSRAVDVPPQGGLDLQSEIQFKEAQLWSNDTPKLYALHATLLSRPTTGGKKSQWNDDRRVTFGFRWFEASGVAQDAILRLNGRRIRLISAISWGFWGLNGLWPTPELAEREVRAAKELGLNCIQFHRNVGKKEVLDAQDRLGLMRYMEPGGGQTSFGEKFSLYSESPKEKIDATGAQGDPQTFAERYMEEKITRMVRDHRSHPSLLLYCVQNEIHPDLRNPRIFRILHRIHQEDPSRIVALKSGFPSGHPSINQAWLQPYSTVVRYDSGDGHSGWWDDHTVGGPGVWRDDMYRNPGDFTHRSENTKEVVMWGEMLGAAAPDNHAAMVRELRTKGGKSYDLRDHTEILSAYDRFLDRWGFRTAFPTVDALFTSVGNKSYDFWGRVIETARLAEANDYFVISGWESTAIENHSGLVDNLRGFKGDPQLIKTRLAPLRPVIKAASVVYALHSQASIDLFLLNETNTSHTGSMHVWMEDPAAQKSEVGTFAVPPWSADRFVYPVATNVTLQPFASEGTYTLHAELSGSNHGSGQEQLLVVDPAGRHPLSKRIGMLSIQPSLRKPFELLPGVRVEPYVPGERYDVLVAANKFIRPYETQTEPNTEIQRTEDDELYRSINYGDANTLEFLFANLPRGNARVTLKFAEPFQNFVGARVFDVALNDTTVLKDFDVFSAAGGKNIAYDQSFTVPVPDGVLEVTFPKVPKPSARICAIKIEAGDTVIAVNCGGKDYKDGTGLVWKQYEAPVQFDQRIMEEVRNGIPLLVLSEGDVATEKYAEELGRAGAFQYLGHVGEARASWMGSWYFVKSHPVYDGLPTNCAMGSYYQVPVSSSCGVLLEGKNVEVFAGYSRDHDRNVGAASFTAALGRGKILFHSIPGVVSGLHSESPGMHPVLLKRLIANSLWYLGTQ
jgi:hypothetical protein